MARTQYFLGGNTAHGFYSLYDSLCPPENGDFLWILKGGPGCGKSSFLKKLGAAAEAHGLDVEYVLCSGDPDSLDGVYIPALRLGYADGTAPHALEPKLPAVSGLYLDLGQFYDREALKAHSDEIRRLHEAYRAHYQTAYRILSAASGAAEAAAGERTEPHLSFTAVHERPGRLSRRFSRALGCKGLVEAEKHTGRKIGTPADLAALQKRALAAGYDVVAYANPILPELTERIDLPQLGKRFLADVRFLEDAFSPFLCDAVQELIAAKELHDELEAVYNPHVDFEAVYSLADRQIKNVFPDV